MRREEENAAKNVPEGIKYVELVMEMQRVAQPAMVLQKGEKNGEKKKGSPAGAT